MLFTLAAFFVVIGVLVTAHELGHFLAAKLCGVKVLTFSFGIGPRVLGITFRGTDYRISAFPIGGYVRMYGDDFTDEKHLNDKDSFLAQNTAKKMLIIFAGPAFSILLAPMLYLVLLAQEREVSAPVVGTVFVGSAAEKANLQAGDEIVSIDGNPMQSLVDVQRYVSPRHDQTLQLSIRRDGQAITLNATPAPASAATFFDAERKVGRLGFSSGTVRATLAPFKPCDEPKCDAERFSVRDEILKIEDRDVKSMPEALEILKQHANAKMQSLRILVKEDISATTNPADPTVAPNPQEKNAPTAPAEQPKNTVRYRWVVATQTPRPLKVTTDRFAVTREEFDIAKVADLVESTKSLLNEIHEKQISNYGVLSASGLVVDVQTDTAAHYLGLQKDADVIVSIDGRPVLSPGDLENTLLAAPDAIHVIGTLRNNEGHVCVFRMAPSPDTRYGGIKVFGAFIGAYYASGPVVKVKNSMAVAVQQSFEMTKESFVSTLQMLQALVTGRLSLRSLGGPISMARISGDAARQGSDSFIEVMALITMSIGVFNLLPIPILDGGQMTIFAVEAVRRKRLSAAMRTRLSIIGLVLVAGLMLLGIGNDLIFLLVGSQ